MIEAGIPEFIVECRYEQSLDGGASGTVLVGGMPIVTFRSTSPQADAGLNTARQADRAAVVLEESIRARLHDLGVDVGDVPEREADGQ